MENKEIDYIARHYRKGSFNADAAWRELGISQRPKHRGLRVAAAVASIVVVSATAAIIYNVVTSTPPQDAPALIEKQSALTISKAIDFEDASLGDVVEKIETTYGVKIKNLPEKPEAYTLSLHYEGTPSELIDVINEILGTEMTVSED